jgi:uncharacterized membrane protein YccC
MEPSLSWGLRMGLCSTVPVVWGLATGHLEAAEWIALTADSICWVALKGTYAQRLRILSGGAVLAIMSALLGSVTGHFLWLSVLCMGGVAFMAGLFKNLGERGSGLALCLYVLFLIANAHPVHGKELEERLLFVVIGGLWNAAVSLFAVFYTPAQQPYRRSIAVIWQTTSGLVRAVAKGWDGRDTRSTYREIYLAEKAVRDAIDSSFAFYELASHQVKAQEHGAEYELAQVRKAASLVATHVSAVAEELEALRLQLVPEDLRLRLAALLRALQRTSERMATFVLTRRPEERTLAKSMLEAQERQVSILSEFDFGGNEWLEPQIRRVMQLCERSAKLINRSIERLSLLPELSMIRSYSVIKTIYILHPRHWWRSIRLLFNLDSHTARYAVRTALAAALAMGIYKYFDLAEERGYWLPLTVIIVLQPYFIATFRKALDRLIGTLAGGLAGGLLLLLPAGLHLKELMLFVSAIAMIHYFKVQYRISAFFITLNLVLLLSVSRVLKPEVILWRAGFTLAGAIIAVIAGFTLLPAWDRTWLPRFSLRAFERNWCYFRHTFSGVNGLQSNWTRFKRSAEVSNSNAFDSFNRATQEPGGLRRSYAPYYALITHSVRITRELNNIHLEHEAASSQQNQVADPETVTLLRRIAESFVDAIKEIQPLSGKPIREELEFQIPDPPPALNAAQKLYLARLEAELRQSLQNIRSLRSPGSANPEPAFAS